MKKIVGLCKIGIIFLLFNLNSFSRSLYVVNPGEDKDIQPNVQLVINSAVNGDSVILPNGKFIVNKSIVITKFISLISLRNGRYGTTLYRSENISDSQIESWGPIVKYNINSVINSKIVVSGIFFRSKYPSSVDTDSLSKAADIGIQMIKCVGFTIKNCNFKYFGNGAVSVLHDDSIAYGLIKQNSFIHNCKGRTALGLGYGVVIYGSNKKWIKNPGFGSSNFIFIEDNIFDYHRHSIAAGGCALYVFRNNTVINNVAGNTAHAIDAHEARLDGGLNHYSTRAIEVYNNTIINNTFKDGTTNCPDGTTLISGKPATWLVECAIRPRGGEAVVHDNYIEGYRFGVGPVVDPAKGLYPVPYQIGYWSGDSFGSSHFGDSDGKESGDLYVWQDNYLAYNSTSQCVYFYNYSPNYLVKDRDFHLYKKPGYLPFTYPHPGFN